jgi:hypothetical protein
MRRLVLALLVLACIAGASALVFFKYPRQSEPATFATPEEQSDVYVRFDMEAYDSIQKNYWQKADDASLANLFTLSLEKASNTSTTSVAATDRASTAKMLDVAFSKLASASDKQQLALTILQVALYNLAPQGRDELLSSQAVTQLRQTVANVNPTTNLYNEIGATPSSTPAQVNAAYAETKANLEAHPTATTSQALARASYVRDVLSDQRARANYNTTGAEPTVFPHTLGTTLYLDVDKISPTTLQEFAFAIDDASTTPLSSLIIDLRGNIGGSLDLAPYLVGIFVGQNQYVFDLFHQGDYQTQRSPVPKLGELERYTDIAVLTDGMTQSTAEVWTAAMKRFHLATVVGATTRGWGSVENTYPLTTTIDASTTYALLLVNSLTIRDDGNPIEGNGVVPDVSISDKNWKAELPQHFHSQSIISALEQVATKPPLQ